MLQPSWTPNGGAQAAPLAVMAGRGCVASRAPWESYNAQPPWHEAHLEKAFASFPTHTRVRARTPTHDCKTIEHDAAPNVTHTHDANTSNAHTQNLRLNTHTHTQTHTHTHLRQGTRTNR